MLMNRIKSILIFVLILLLLCGCKNNKHNAQENETVAVPTEEMTVVTEATVETIPPVPGVEMYIPEEGDGVTLDEENSEATEHGEINTDQEQDAETDKDVKNTEATSGTEPIKESTEKEDDQNKQQESSTVTEMSDYEKYINMSGDEQAAFIESFSSVASFFEWLNNAQAEYEASIPKTEIDGDTLDFSEILGK